jgi:hypothetical protein
MAELAARMNSEELRAVVRECATIELPSSHAAAGAPAFVEHHDLMIGGVNHARRGEPRHPGADHYGPHH